MAVIKAEENHSLYFDSFGFPPYRLNEIFIILNQCKRWIHDSVCIKPLLTAVCGQYSIFFCTLLLKLTMDRIISLLNSTDKPANHCFIFNYIRKKYSKFLFTQKLKGIDLSLSSVSYISLQSKVFGRLRKASDDLLSLLVVMGKKRSV